MRRQPHAFAWTLLVSIATRGKCFSLQNSQTRTSSSLPRNENDFCMGEVVGASGRMGSLWLRPGNGTSAFVAVPRGVAPGCLSPEGTPIVVATPSQSWPDIFTRTLPERRNDLVWVGNGLPIDDMEGTTVVVPHYGILKVGSDPVLSPSSPSTFICGKHAPMVQEILEQHGVSTKLLNDWGSVRVAAARKLLWASCMWLLCHANHKPISVAQVHSDHHDQLEALLQELSPALMELTGQACSVKETMEYLEQYSLSIPDAIPSKELAIAEVRERNGVWLQLRNKHQPLHQELLRRAGGPDVLAEALASKEQTTTTPNNRMKRVLNNVGLTVWGERLEHPIPRPCQDVVVVGAGIIGSCVALNLARQGINVTVYDRLSPEHNVGATTRASWAWINANGKVPLSYQCLNQLGMRAWKHEPVLSALPQWSGSLVAFASRPKFAGGYVMEGPLTPERIQELEPEAAFAENCHIYYFPQEGSVDPSVAVKALHKAASDLGVRFVSHEEVVEWTHNNGHVAGVVTQSVSSNATSVTKCDLVVVAAGVGSAALGGIPLLDRPGQIVFCNEKTSGSSGSWLLRRILVDTVRKSHVLQRRDGEVVVGGGDLETGGSSVANQDAGVVTSDNLLLNSASLLVPDAMEKLASARIERAVRPFPADGLPAVGHLEPGLYGIVTHSGVTLAPLLGALASVEIVEGVSCDVLEPYRPVRLLPHKNTEQGDPVT